MKTIRRIAKTELSLLFYSPIAWFLLIVFLVQCGLTFTESMEAYLTAQNAHASRSTGRSSLTFNIFSSPYGIMSNVLKNVYLYIPLLTMALISRETSSGTIKLLQSSPVRISSIVFGKFLAMMVTNLLLTAVVGILMAYGAGAIVSPDIGILLSGLLGLYLLLCAYTSIGMFMSCLTSYQVVAAIGTFIVFAFLTYVQELWQDIAFVRDLTYFLSVHGRADKMTRGLITSKDVLYFLVIMYVFLGFTICRMRAGIESIRWPVRAARYVAILVSALLIGYVTSRPGLIAYWDTTAPQSHTLLPNSQRIIQEIGDEPLEVTTYINLLDPHYRRFGTPSLRNRDLDRWEQYVRFKPDIHFRYVYFYDSILANGYIYESNPGFSVDQLAQRYVKAYKVSLEDFKKPTEIRKEIDLRPELNRYVMHLKYKDRTTFLRMFDDPNVWPSEREVSVAFKRLLQSKMPRIVFLTGEYERSIEKGGDREYKRQTSDVMYRYALVNQGFDVSSMSLKTQELPNDLAALVIADPRAAFDTTVLRKIRRYINNGGNLLIAGEPGKQSVLNPLLSQLDIQLTDGVLVQPDKNLTPDFVRPYLTQTAAGFYHPLVKDRADSLTVYMPGVSGISYSAGQSGNVEPLLVNDARISWLKKGKVTVDSADIFFAAEDGDQKVSLPTAVRYVRKFNGNEQRIVVTGDADFFSNLELMVGREKAANFDFNLALFKWLSYGEFPIDTFRPRGKDDWIYMTDAAFTRMKIILLGVLPVLLLLAGTVILIRRKRK